MPSASFLMPSVVTYYILENVWEPGIDAVVKAEHMCLHVNEFIVLYLHFNKLMNVTFN